MRTASTPSPDSEERTMNTPHSHATRLTQLALLTAVALILFLVEAQIPPLVAIPGVKLGLANIITLVTFYLYGRRDALMVLLVRIFLGSVFSGQMLMLLFSLSGGLFCYAVCALLYPRIPLKKLWLLSMIGAVCHNIGQILAAILVLGTADVLWYLPALLISGLISGCFTGLVAGAVLTRLPRA